MSKSQNPVLVEAAPGALRADIANLKARVSGADRTTVNWKAVAEKLGPSHQLVTAHSKQSHSVSVRVYARKK